MLAGPILDIYGVGLSLLGSFGRVDNDTGVVAKQIVNPASVQVDGQWFWGVFFGLTTDLDIFEAVFQKYFNSPSYPTLSTSGASK
jgi:hypothetical protein